VNKDVYIIIRVHKNETNSGHFEHWMWH